jgi:hypothetical protein
MVTIRSPGAWTPSWCTGGFVVGPVEVVGLSSLVRSAGGPVFSSVLKESEQSGALRADATASSSLELRMRPSCRTLRTAEQARASCSNEQTICSFQATKSQRWMPWRQEPMKDVSDCEKLRGAVD